MTPRRSLRYVGTGLAALYLVLSGVEIVRARAFGVTPWFAFGFYPAETQPAGSSPEVLRWTAGRPAVLREPVLGQVLRVPLGAPGRTDAVDVVIKLDGRQIDVVPVSNEFRGIDIPLAALHPVRSGVLPRLAPTSLVRFGEDLPVTAFRRVTGRRWPPAESMRLLSGWGSTSRPEVIEIGFEATSTFVPEGSADTRELGVAVGELAWLLELPDGGVGFYGWEYQEERPFRWTARWAVQSLPVAKGTEHTLVGAVRSHPLQEGADPLAVTFFCAGTEVAHVQLDDVLWTPVRIDLSGAPSDSLLALRVSRTWNPAAAGFSPDRRDLGVAVTALTWE